MKVNCCQILLIGVTCSMFNILIIVVLPDEKSASSWRTTRRVKGRVPWESYPLPKNCFKVSEDVKKHDTFTVKMLFCRVKSICLFTSKQILLALPCLHSSAVLMSKTWIHWEHSFRLFRIFRYFQCGVFITQRAPKKVSFFRYFPLYYNKIDSNWQ